VAGGSSRSPSPAGAALTRSPSISPSDSRPLP
jgi:hypothetical protein